MSSVRSREFVDVTLTSLRSSVCSTRSRASLNTERHHCLLQHCTCLGCQNSFPVPAQGPDTIPPASLQLLCNECAWDAGKASLSWRPSRMPHSCPTWCRSLPCSTRFRCGCSASASPLSRQVRPRIPSHSQQLRSLDRSRGAHLPSAVDDIPSEICWRTRCWVSCTALHTSPQH